MAIRRPRKLGPGKTRQQITDEIQSNRRWGYLLDDLVIPFAIAVLWLFLPFEISTLGRVVGALAIATMAPVDTLLRRYGRPDRRNFQIGLSRVAIGIAIGATVPVAWHPANILVTAVIVGTIPAEPRRRLVPMAALGWSGMTAAGIFNGIDNWYLSSSMLALVALGAEFAYREWREQRNEADERYDELIDRAPMFAWEIDLHSGMVLSVTGNVDAVLGYHPKELIGRPWTDFTVPSSVDQSSVPRQGGVERHLILKGIHRLGHIVTLRGTVVANRSMTVLRGISTDVSELAEATEALRHQAEHDSLTGLSNRAVLERGLTTALDTMAEADNAYVALLIVDLDRFKEVNDTLGHPAGDRLLRILAKRFRSSFPDCEVVARIGGDEFAIVATAPSRQQITELGNRIYDITMGQVEFDGIKLAVSCSIGIAYAPDHGTDVEGLMARADMAVYVAKRAGGGVRVFESAPEVMSVERLKLTAEISGALDRGEFRLYMQPLVDIATGRIVGAEGLARWHHPEYALLTPEDFMSILEVSSDYQRFTAEMLSQAAAFAHKCAAIGQPLHVAVNLCSRSFRDHGLPDLMAGLLDTYQLPGSSLTLEVTESDLLDEHGDTAPVFEALAALGLRLSIDDFGTGYSSLQRLRALDVDEVKIDRSFVDGLSVVPADAIIVHTVIQLARLLEHNVVAEGIETVEQLAVLRYFGCSIGQGYLFSRPMPADQLIELIAESPQLHLPELPDVEAFPSLIGMEAPLPN